MTSRPGICRLSICLSGFGIHRCVGNRLAEMQLTILWEEILKRFPPIEVGRSQSEPIQT